MQGKKRKLAALCLLIAMLAGVFAGCARQKEEKQELWVLTEQTEWDGMNSQARQMIELFEKEHPGFSVKLDILPTEKTERELYLKVIRAQLMSGRGPDVFLLPTETTTTRYKKKLYTDAFTSERLVSTQRQPLFLDAEQLMQNGMFANIGPYYDTDETLGKECLNSTIMDAGLYRDGRYLLPIRYDFPVLYVNLAGLSRFGLDLDDLDGNILELMERAINSGEKALACGVEPFYLRLGRGFTALGQTMDYQHDRVTIEKDSLVKFLAKMQALEELVGESDDHRVKLLYRHLTQPYLTEIMEPNINANGEIDYYGTPIKVEYQNLFPGTLPLHIGTLDEAPMAFAFSVSEHSEYAMLPLRGIDNKLSAYVTYYGAVGVGSQYSQEAYEFLRLFLSESAQFEKDRPFHTDWFLQGKRWNPILIEAGWPVRIRGSADAIWRLQRTQTSGSSGKSQVYRMRLTEEDLPPLQAKIDRVYFGCVLEQDFAQMVRSLNDQDTGEPSDVDIDAMAEEFIEKLTWHVMEG